MLWNHKRMTVTYIIFNLLGKDIISVKFNDMRLDCNKPFVFYIFY